MKVGEQVVSLELAKEMKELGIEQNSLWWWVSLDRRSPHMYLECIKTTIGNIRPGAKDQYSAFTVAELLNMLPEGYYTFYSGHLKTWACFSDNEEFNNKESINFIADTEANARGKMLIYLKKNGLL